MPNYTIDLTIFRLKLLLSDHQNTIPSELETRFSTTNIYPPFDPNIHTPVDWDQPSLSTDCNEEDVLLPLNRKLVEDVESVETEVRVRDWTRDVARRMWAGQEDDDDSGNTTHKNDTAPNRQDSDTNENDQRSSPTTVDNKRDYETDSETEDTRSGKRRRSARIAARQESSSNT